MKVFILLGLGALSILSLSHTNYAAIKHDRSISIDNQHTVKENAFNILRTKCNVCHVKMNKRKIFTRNNMSGFAPEINTQVFIKRRMPKGKDVKLTEKEYQLLSTWLRSLKA
jgi:uncharacterized membrane protein